jgi:hypothetical protein
MSLNLKADYTAEQNIAYRAGLQEVLDYINKRRKLNLDVDVVDLEKRMMDLQELSLLGD